MTSSAVSCTPGRPHRGTAESLAVDPCWSNPFGSDSGAASRPAQAPRAVVMIRPHHARPNRDECADNGFMGRSTACDEELARAAYREVTAMVAQLEGAGVEVLLFEDEGRATPDSVFPNNWLTTHPDGTIALHAMRGASRRLEPRLDIVETLRERYAVARLVDLRAEADAGVYLEGTGVMVIDHPGRVTYVGRSARADDRLLRAFCAQVGLRPVVFDTADHRGHPIYHTNVMMALGSTTALACLDYLPSVTDRRRVRRELETGGRALVELTRAQVANFAGNALEVMGSGGPIWVMSARGLSSLTRAQRRALERGAEVLPVTIPTVELAGGSARCMLAGVHLPPR